MRSFWGRVCKALLIAGVLVALVIADRNGLLLADTRDWQRFHGQRVRVSHVVDGDTIDVMPLEWVGLAGSGDAQATRIRLWGIDTPETAKPTLREPGEPFAQEATAFTQRLAQGAEVTLTLETQRVRDRFGRLLAYVTLPDGTVLNERLLQAGLATADGRWDHAQRIRYALVEQVARRSRVGLWSTPEPPAKPPPEPSAESPPRSPGNGASRGGR